MYVFSKRYSPYRFISILSFVCIPYPHFGVIMDKSIVQPKPFFFVGGGGETRLDYMSPSIDFDGFIVYVTRVVRLMLPIPGTVSSWELVC